MDPPSTTTRLQRLLVLLQDGDSSARDGLLEHSLERVRLLARRMFRRDSDLRKLEETDDIVQKAMIRLHRALEQLKPPNVVAYFGLAARQIRWVLLNLAREARSAKPGPMESEDGLTTLEGEPTDLLEWAELHTAIDRLPESDREMFDMLFYQGMTQPEAASFAGQSLRTIKRRWQHARLLLRDALRGDWPSLGHEKE